ncbi:MAG: cell surface receptor IPT/TIG domain-containing protein, partial [Thermoanaerobacteraceae bacterium]|nr:cell surface receptor IPT/TIG domain-containing protein [Thermoanaerobacteraceae bacterium]
MRKSKKILSAILIIMMLLSSIPNQSKLAYGYDKDTYIVTEIVIGKEHDSNRFTTGMSLSIKGRELEGASVFIEYGSKYEQLTNPKINTDSLLYFELTKPEDWDKLKNLNSIIVGDASISIGNQGAMPTITDVTPKVKKDETLQLKGTNFELIESGAVTVKYGTGLLFNTIDKDNIKVDPEENTAEVTGFEKAELGLQDIEITREFDIESVYFNQQYNNKTVNIKITHTYNGQFRIIEDLNISDDIEMFPNRGAEGSKVYFKASQLRQYDVYFLKATDGTDPYTNANKGKNPSPLQQTDDNMYVFTVEVPDIVPGEYWIVLTNQVPGNKDPMQAVSGEYIYTKERFTVIQGGKSATIDTIQPNSGPDTGSLSTITGRYLGTLNVDDLEINKEFQVPQRSVSGDGVMTVIYEDNGGVIGKYREANVTSVKKTIKVIIGPQANVQEEGTSFSSDIDKLVVRINPNTEGSNPVKDVVVETTTTIITEDGKSNEKTYTFTERAELPKGYTFISS